MLSSCDFLIFIVIKNIKFTYLAIIILLILDYRIILWSIILLRSELAYAWVIYKLLPFFSHTTSLAWNFIKCQIGLNCIYSQINRDFHYWMQINRGGARRGNVNNIGNWFVYFDEFHHFTYIENNEIIFNRRSLTHRHIWS